MWAICFLATITTHSGPYLEQSPGAVHLLTQLEKETTGKAFMEETLYLSNF